MKPIFLPPTLAIACLALLAGCASLTSPDATPSDGFRQRKEAALKDFETRRDQAEYEAAAARLRQNDTAGCRKAAARLLERNAGHTAARLLLAEAALDEGQVENARGEVAKVLETAPNDPQAHYTMGLVYDSGGQTAEAAACYAKAVELAPDSEVYAASYKAAQAAAPSAEPAATATAADGVAGSLSAASAASTAMQEQAKALLAEAEAALQSADPEKAVELLSAAQAANPHDPQIAIGGGVLLLRHNRPAEAIGLLAAAAGRHPQCGPLHRALGTAYYRQGDYRQSQVALQQALSLDRSDGLTYFLMGCTLAKLGQAEAAEGHFKQARLIDPRLSVRR